VFPHKVCVNLDRRPDRWGQMREKFARLGVRSVRRFAAVDGLALPAPPGWQGTPGAYGCLLSHLCVIAEARERRLPSVLIFEDDVAFDPRLRENFRDYFAQVPPDWEMLHFGVLHVEEPAEVAPNVRRIRRAFSTYAYALRESVYDAFIELNREATTPVDVNNHVLQAARACYCFAPHLAWVEHDPSDVQGRQKDHWYLRESLVIHGEGMERLLARTAVVMAYANPNNHEGARRNLRFLAGSYRERLPGVSLVVVEQGARPTVAPGDLPEGCGYAFLRGEGPFDRGRCFNAGLALAGEARSLLIFSDADVFVEEWDVRGNLRVCERHDCATGFGGLLELSEADTRELLQRRGQLTPWFDASNYPATEPADPFAAFCVFNRAAFEEAGGWRELNAGAPTGLRLKDDRLLRVFHSPNQALCLRRG
jgi:GR25 family glycosyltransferase involved in LPS biosynthesis